MGDGVDDSFLHLLTTPSPVLYSNKLNTKYIPATGFNLMFRYEPYLNRSVTDCLTGMY